MFYAIKSMYFWNQKIVVNYQNNILCKQWNRDNLKNNQNFQG